MDIPPFPSPATFIPGLPLLQPQASEKEATKRSHNEALPRETGVVFSVRSIHPISFLSNAFFFSNQNLTVVALGGATECHESLLSIFNPTNILRRIQSIRHPPVKEILTEIKGVVRPGEMLLVLGRPGAGCTTLLKVLATLTAEFRSVEGKISYDGVDPNDMGSNFRGDICFCSEDDIHFPSLNVEQTLVFYFDSQ